MFCVHSVLCSLSLTLFTCFLCCTGEIGLYFLGVAWFGNITTFNIRPQLLCETQVSHSTLVYTSELILCSTICVHSARGTTSRIVITLRSRAWPPELTTVILLSLQFDMASLIDDQVQKQMKTAAKEHDDNARKRRMSAFARTTRWHWNSGNNRRQNML